MQVDSEAKKIITPDRAGKVIFEGNYDYSIRVYKDVALATFKSKLTQVQDNKELESVEVRSLEKKDGDWKITYLGTVRLTTYDDRELEEGEEGHETEETE